MAMKHDPTFPKLLLYIIALAVVAYLFGDLVEVFMFPGLF